MMHRAFIAIFITVLVAGCSGSSTTTPTAALVPYETATGCCGWDTQASGGTPARLTAAAQGFQFAFPVGPNSIHYLVAPQGGNVALRTEITANFTITGNSPVFIETNPCTPTPGRGMVRLYFQQAGDNWSGAGAFAFYRWWSAPQNLLIGTFRLSIPLNPADWSSVMGALGDSSSAATAGFNGAISNVQAFGVTFGGCFAGHGAQLSSGNAIFNMTKFTAQ